MIESTNTTIQDADVLPFLEMEKKAASIQSTQAVDPVSNVNKSSSFERRYIDTMESLKTEREHVTSKPVLEQTLPKNAYSPAFTFAKMMDNAQKYIQGTSVTAELKYNQVGRKISRQQESLRIIQQETLQAHKAQETWSTRQLIANCVLNSVTTLTGVGLTLAGNPIAGISMIASGVGSTASSLMGYYQWNSTLTAATSIVSGLIGVAGGLGSGIAGLVRGPAALASQLTSDKVVTALQAAGMVSSLVSNAVTGYSAIERNNTSALLSELEAAQTKADSSLRVLQQKYSGAAQSYQNSVKNLSPGLKSIAKANSRYAAALHGLTAEYLT